MLTDGALRMLVLMHFHDKGYSPFTLAYIFLLYEFMGVITNFMAGIFGRRFGLSTLLIAGTSLQVLSLTSLGLLSINSPEWFMIFCLIFFQGLCGVAKDLTKIGSKTAVKFLSNENIKGKLFRNVSWLTGSKNTVKGLGFFVGAFLITIHPFSISLYILAFILFIALMIALNPVLKTPELNTKSNRVQSEGKFFSDISSINYLSLSRIFLFGARDIWFVIGIPLFLLEVFSTMFVTGSNGKVVFLLVGSFMALWVIFYGFVQSQVPAIIQRKTDLNIESSAFRWSIIVIFPTLFLTLLTFVFDNTLSVTLIVIIITLLFIFGGFFAINSSIHSYLILKLTSKKNASEDVGFYYSANAVGRFFGTLLSGVSYQLGGLSLCLFFTTVFLVCSSYFIAILAKKLDIWI
jgi:MFS family permease